MANSCSLSQVKYHNWNTHFVIEKTPFKLKVPGQHNLMNALASIAFGMKTGISLEKCSRGLTCYEGIERRHILIGEKNGITVIDDFAHNPAKVEACVKTVKIMCETSTEKRRVVAIFHPHGYDNIPFEL